MIGKGSNERITGKSNEKIEKRTDRETFSREKQLDFSESSSFSGKHVRENLGSEEAIGKISGSRELSKEISDSEKCAKEGRGRYRKSELKESVKCAISSRISGSKERLVDGPAECDKKVYSDQIYHQ